MIVWDEYKARKLQKERGSYYQEVNDIILSKRYLDILDHPKRENQDIYVIELNGYIHAAPFTIDEDENIIIKTVYPSRKLQKKYKG